MKYHVIDMANISSADIDIVNRTFNLWKDVYGEELSSRGLTLHNEDFWTCRLLAVLENGTDIVGAHIYNVFDLRTLATTHKYFLDITPERIEILKDQKSYKIMSMEYLLVNPTYRGQKSGMRWGEVVVGLGFKVLCSSPWNAIIGVARMDKKVHAMGLKMGCKETEVITKNQTPCRVMTMAKHELKNHEDPKVQNTIETLWDVRNDTSPWNTALNPALKQAS